MGWRYTFFWWRFWWSEKFGYCMDFAGFFFTFSFLKLAEACCTRLWLGLLLSAGIRFLFLSLQPETWMTAVTSGRWTERGHWCNSDIPLSQSPVFLNLLLFFFLVLLSPALGAEASPSLVAIKTASFLAQQLWLVHMDCTPLIYHLYRFKDTLCQSQKQSLQNSIKKAYCRVNNYAVYIELWHIT